MSNQISGQQPYTPHLIHIYLFIFSLLGPKIVDNFTKDNI